MAGALMPWRLFVDLTGRHTDALATYLSKPRRQEDVMANPLQERYAEMLLARISSDTHPSGTLMNMFEAVASPRLLVAYILHLMELIENDSHPSIPMMQRVQRLIAGFGS